MNIFSLFYNEILWRPLFNGLVFIYNVLPWKDLGLTIVVFTVIIRIILTPLLLKARRSQQEMTFLQPEIKKIQEKFKNDRESQSKATMELYAKYKVNPFSGCLTMLVQLPILIALFDVFRKGFGEVKVGTLYSFMHNPEIIKSMSLGFFDLSKGNIYFGIAAALTQYLQTKMTINQSGGMNSQQGFAKSLQWQSLYFFPALVLLWSYSLPSALVLYWTVLNILGIVEALVWKPKHEFAHQHGINKAGS
ncbi:MAG: YidC/Oxa1 family membrane protein insertase [bacterium]|nr:YidC/Oxa1 family membrane protein insertase [bacterium]